MRFFVDTANVDEIRKANDMGIICGVTTNPSLIAKEGRDFHQVIQEIASIVDGPISGEVKATTEDAEGMVNCRNPPQYGCKDPHDSRRLKGCENFKRRGSEDQCDSDFYSGSGTSCCKSRRKLRLSLPGTSG